MSYHTISAVFQNLSRPMIPKLLCIGLAVLIMWQLVAGIVTILTLRKPLYNTKNTYAMTKHVRKKASNVSLNTAFFGEYVPNDVDVKKSRLNLKVVGVLFSSQEGLSHVILHTSGGGDHTYHIGESVPGGAVIKRITVDGILVERNGALESLSLLKNELIFEAQPKPLVED